MPTCKKVSIHASMITAHFYILLAIRA